MQPELMSAVPVVSGTMDIVGPASAGGISILGAFWWIIRKIVNATEKKIDRTDAELKQAQIDLEKFKSYSEGNYVKNDSLNRVHDRIDQVMEQTSSIYKLLVQKLG